jgi:hypothetical protein
MRDDPRAALCTLLALAVYGGAGDARARPALAAALLTLAFFVKATAPLAGAAALLWAAAREGKGTGRRQVAWLLGTGVVLVASGIAFLQWGLGCDFLGNGLYYVLVAPARASRTWPEACAALGSDLCGQPGGNNPRELALPALVAFSALLAATRAIRARLDRYDILVAAAWLKTIVAYRSWGTDLNHLLDLALFSALHVTRALAGWLTPIRALSLFAIALGLGQPWLRLLPEPGTPTLDKSPLNLARQGLLMQAQATTLCEEPFLAWLTDSRPLVTDPFLTFATLARAPDIRRRWFGPANDPAAVHRMVLMHDPTSTNPWVEHWYRHLHFDAEFLAMVRRDWHVLLRSDTATMLVRKH